MSEQINRAVGVVLSFFYLFCTKATEVCDSVVVFFHIVKERILYIYCKHNTTTFIAPAVLDNTLYSAERKEIERSEKSWSRLEPILFQIQGNVSPPYLPIHREAHHTGCRV